MRRPDHMVSEDLFTTFPVIRTEHLLLREPRFTDAAYIFSIRSNSEVTDGYCTEKYTEETQATNWIRSLVDGFAKKQHILWFITLNGEERVIGNCTLWHLDLSSACGELGYELHRDYWGKGIASEAANAVLKFGFSEMGLNRIEALPFRHNVSSHKLLDRLGFKLEGVMRQKHLFKGTYYDQFFYGMLKDDWDLLLG